MLKNNFLPNIGYGTWKLPADNETISIVENAIKIGYRLIDTASAYNNEEQIGMAIHNSKIDRNDIVISGKLWNEDRGHDNIINACKKTIDKLNCGFLDLYLIHWPASPALYDNWSEINIETWKTFQELKEMGLVKHIGVCNFNKKQLDDLIKKTNIIPEVNQIEFHPGFMQMETIEFCKKNNIIVEAWSPLGSGKMLKKQELIDLANKYNISVAQLCIKWCLQNGVIPLPKSKNEDRMANNLDVNNFEISNEDMEILNNLPYLGGSGLDSETLTLFK